MVRGLSVLTTGALALAGTGVLLAPPSFAATNDLFHPYTATMPG